MALTAHRRAAFHPFAPTVVTLLVAAALLAAAVQADLPRVPLWVLLGAVAGYSISGSV